MTERTEWPTAAKIERLREAGVVHYSRAATACCVGAVVSVVVGVDAARWSESTARYHDLAARGETLAAWRSIAAHGFEVGAVMAGCVGAAVLIAAAAQTRFFFRPGILALRFDRLNPWAGGGIAAPLRRWVGALGCVLLGGVAAAGVCGWLFRDMAGLLNHGIDYVVERPRRVVEWFVPALSAALFLAGALGWGVSRFAFRLRHRMTRAEVLADQAQE